MGKRLEDAKALAYQKSIGGLMAVAEGRFRSSVELCDAAVQLFRDRCVGVSWEIGITQRTALLSLAWIGELGELRRRVDPELGEARRRDDRFVEVDRLCWRSFVDVADDDPQRARDDLGQAGASLPVQGYSIPHFIRFALESYVEAYAGSPLQAWERFEQEWPRVQRSMLLRVQTARLTGWYRRAVAALRLAAGAPGSGSLRRLAAADARRIERERMPWSTPLAGLVRAGVARLSGHAPEAARLLERAAAGFDAADMPLYAAAARLSLSTLQGGEQARRVRAEAEAYLQGQGVRCPPRFAAMIAPGFVAGEEGLNKPAQPT